MKLDKGRRSRGNVDSATNQATLETGEHLLLFVILYDPFQMSFVQMEENIKTEWFYQMIVHRFLL